MSFLTVLPLAFVMIAGPQIITATLLATGHDARRTSLAFLAGAALAVTAGTMVAYWVTSLLERAAGPSSQGTAKTVIDWLVIVLFLFLMVRTYRRRKDTRTPKWMGRLQTADAGFSFRLGLLLFLVMPTNAALGWTAAGRPAVAGQAGRGATSQGAGLDDEQLVGHQRDRHRVLPRPHHLRALQLIPPEPPWV
jgi:cytochrome c biogenesis protein CcdA